MSGRCLGVCSGNVTNFPANFLDCHAHISSVASCYDVTLPTRKPPGPTRQPPVPSRFFFCTNYTKRHTISAFVVKNLLPFWLIVIQLCTGWPKNLAQFLMNALTLANISRFSKFFHCQNQEKICNNIITKDPTTP